MLHNASKKYFMPSTNYKIDDLIDMIWLDDLKKY